MLDHSEPNHMSGLNDIPELMATELSNENFAAPRMPPTPRTHLRGSFSQFFRFPSFRENLAEGAFSVQGLVSILQQFLAFALLGWLDSKELTQ